MNSVHHTENILFYVIIQIIIMIGLARIFNNIFRRLQQPGVIGEIVAGLLLGPSLFGYFFPDISKAIFGEKPDQAITILSQLGLLFLMFQIGADFEFKKLSEPKTRRLVTYVTIVSIIVPFITGCFIGYLSHDIFAPKVAILPYILFFGTALAITAVPIMGRILKQFDLEKTEMGLVSISSAALNDVVGWIILATITAIAVNNFSYGHLAFQIIGLLLLIPIGHYIIVPLAAKITGNIKSDNDEISPNNMAIIIIGILLFGLYTYKLGIFTIFGGFVMGYYFHHNRHFSAVWRRQVTGFVMVFLLPIFFTFTGLRTNVLGIFSWHDLMWLGVILLGAIGAKIIPVYFVARKLGEGQENATIIATLMNTRALMELIVLNIAYDMGILPQKVFTMLTIMAIVTTLMTGPILKIYLKKMGHKININAEA